MQRGALEILSEQLPKVTDKVRLELRAAISKIVEAIKKILQATPPDSVVQVALSALETIASTMSVGEEYTLTSSVSLVITKIQSRQTAPAALSALLTLSYAFSPVP